MVWRFSMPETFLDNFVRTAKEDELHKLVVSNMDYIKELLALYDGFKSMYRFFDFDYDDDLLDDPTGCFQC